mgnify:CR=1 FL=1
MELTEANQVVEAFQFENDINTWVGAFIRLTNKKVKTEEQTEACQVIQDHFDFLTKLVK